MGLDIKDDVKQIIDGSQNIIKMVMPEGKEPVILETYDSDKLYIQYQNVENMMIQGADGVSNFQLGELSSLAGSDGSYINLGNSTAALGGTVVNIQGGSEILFRSNKLVFADNSQNKLQGKIDISEVEINNVMYSFTNPTAIGYGSSNNYSDITSQNIDLNKVRNEAKYIRITNTSGSVFRDQIFYKIACTNQNAASKANTIFGGVIDLPGMGLGYVMIGIGPGEIYGANGKTIMTQTSYYFSFNTMTASGNVSVSTSYFSITANAKIEICK